MERVVTRLDISLIQKGNTRGVGDFKQLVLIFILPMWLPACYKSSLLMFIILDPGFTLSFVTTSVDRKFDIFPNILNEPFMVTTPIGDPVVE